MFRSEEEMDIEFIKICIGKEIYQIKKSNFSNKELNKINSYKTDKYKKNYIDNLIRYKNQIGVWK